MDSFFVFFIVMSTDRVQKVHLCLGDKISCSFMQRDVKQRIELRFCLLLLLLHEIAPPGVHVRIPRTE